MIGKTITFQVHHMDRKGKHTKKDKNLTGTVMRYDGEDLHVSEQLATVITHVLDDVGIH